MVSLVVAAVTITGVTACSSENNVKETSADKKADKLTMFIAEPFHSGNIDPSFTDPVAKEITKRTGVTLEITTVKSNDANAELNLLMASGELPDIVFASNAVRRNMLISGGYVQPLEDLIEKYGPNIKKNFGPYLNNWKAEDGKIYGLGQWNWNQPTQYALNLQINTLHMRYDILKELGYPKLSRKNDGDSFITVDEYMKLLDQVRSKYPEMTPALMSGPGAYETMIRSKGVQREANTVFENGKAYYLYDNPYTNESIKFLNKLYLDGYVPKGFATFKREENQNLIANGKVFSTLGDVPGLSEAKVPLSNGNEEKQMVMFYLTANSSVKHILANNYNEQSIPRLMISKNTKNAEAFIKMMDYFATDEGSLLVNAGVEGVSYTKDSKGKLVPKDDIAKGYASWDTNVLKKTGVGGWFNILPSNAGLDKNGNANDINAQKVFDEDRWVSYNNTDWKRFSYPRITSPVGDLTKEKNPEAFEANTKINGYINDRLTRAIVAESPEASAAEWSKAVQQMKTDGLDKLTAALQDNWLKLAKTLNRDPNKLNKVVADQ
jgi:putative aldouronate transport system substrate-binding protein